MRARRAHTVRAGGLLALATAALLAVGCPDAGPAADAGPDADADGGPDGDADGGPDQDADGDADGADDGADAGPVELGLGAVLPSRGPTEGGTWVNLLGEGFVRGIGESPFDARDVTDVTFGDNPAIDIEVVRDDMISVRTPPGLAGPCQVVVENPNGRVVLPGGFTFFDKLITGQVSPTDLAAGGGTPFTVEGSGFTADTRVLVGGRLAPSLELESAELLRMVAPPGAPGLADLEVVNRNGRALIYRGMRYHARPELTGLEPPAGPAEGGTPVAIRGLGLEPGCQVWIGGAPAAGVTWVADDRLEAVSPPGAAGPAEVRVACAVEEALLEGGFVYLPPATGALGLLALAPPAGPEGGGQRVALCGEGFAAGLDEVRFGTAAATGLSVQDDRLAWATTPAGSPGAVDVEVRAGAATAQAPAAFRYFTPLALDGVEPAEAPAAGGAPFTLHGHGFHAGVEVRVGGLPASGLELVSPDELRAISPPGSPGAVELEVRDGDSRASLPWRLTGTLSLLRAEPDSGGQAGGTYVLLLGDGLGADA
ncbi:MAG TPA: IPT/TIG domain-containing protein, partial [Myxococcota bacterium]|nr:IPT/TIG domain-containing protein [Myxococcota bacterium]